MTAERHSDPHPRAVAGEFLSSLVDGECPSGAVEEACGRWRAETGVRDDWHLYHLIGDVMRSDELSSSASGDAAFVRALRGRLAVEPVPLAFMPVAAPIRARRWVAPAAAVAGFMAVGMAVVSLQPASNSAATGWTDRMATVQPADGSGVRRVVGAAAPASAQTVVIDGQVIRDARLDAYFEAHRGAVGALPSALPGGALRSVEILVPQR